MFRKWRINATAGRNGDDFGESSTSCLTHSFLFCLVHQPRRWWYILDQGHIATVSTQTMYFWVHGALALWSKKACSMDKG